MNDALAAPDDRAGWQADFPLLLKRAQGGDDAARDELVQANLKLVWHVVKRFPQGVFDHQDLFQLGCIGLIKAVDRFDPEQGVSFSTYAVPLILGEIRQFLRDDGLVKVGRDARRRARQAREAEERLEAALGRSPSVAEVAAALDMDVSELAEVLEVTAEPLSLQGPIQHGRSDEELHLEDVLADGSPTAGGDGWQEAALLRAGLAGLPERERAIIEMRYFHDLTQTEVAEVLGLSQVQVSRLERRALAALRSMLADA